MSVLPLHELLKVHLYTSFTLCVDDLIRLRLWRKVSDFVSIHCPMNTDTKHLIGLQEIQLMKPSAYLINTARGGIINEQQLIEALANNKIAGAGLDVQVFTICLNKGLEA